MTAIVINVHASHAGPEETDWLARQLIEELLELDVAAAGIAGDGEPPEGAKGDPLSIGEILVTLANSTAMVGVCQLVRGWVSREKGRRIVIRDGDRTLELTEATSEQQQQLIDAFLENAREEA